MNFVFYVIAKQLRSFVHGQTYTVCADCGACFTYIPSVNRYYKVVTHNLDWSAAGSECRSLHQDAHLVVINDEQEQTAVAGMLESMSSGQ